MIPIGQIVEGNLYSQDDARLLLGNGFTAKAAREVICQACRSGQLKNKHWRRRYWFTGHEFLKWVSTWFGAGVDDGEEPRVHEDQLAPVRRPGQDRSYRLGARSPENGEEVGT